MKGKEEQGIDDENCFTLRTTTEMISAEIYMDRPSKGVSGISYGGISRAIFISKDFKKQALQTIIKYNSLLET